MVLLNRHAERATLGRLLEAAHYQHGAMPGARGLEQPAERRTICVTIAQHHRPS